MSKAKLFIPVIVTSIISGMVILPAFYNFIDILAGYSENLILYGIILLAPILTAILLSFTSGYLFASPNSSDKYPFGVIFLLAASIPIVVVYTFLFFRILIICDDYSCGTGLERAMSIVIFCPPTAILSPLIGLSTALFYKLGMKVKYYQYDRNQLIKYRQ